MSRCCFCLPVWLGLAAAAGAAELVFPAASLERDQPVVVIYRTTQLATGRGELALRWTDVHGRIVEDRKLPVTLTDESEIRFTLDLRRARAMKNELHARFTFDGVNKRGAADKRSEEVRRTFIASPPNRDWWDYIVLMWNTYPQRDVATLKTLGVNAGQFSGRNAPPPAFLVENDLRWYAENIATDFYAQYHRYFPDRIQNWFFLQAKELYQKDPTSKEAFKRHPSLSDPIWLDRVRRRLEESARAHSPWGPVFYSLGDESGIADLAAYWDFDFSDHSLAAMREYLRDRYGTLEALNRQWGTEFSTWASVVPATTSEAIKRTDGNWSAWADFKDWMDEAFARALRMGVDAVRSVDPQAFVGIGGAQMPGWGGYDYARLARTLTAIEPYDIGNNIEIMRSLAPATPVVTTSFASGLWEKHRVWYELLHGNRGSLIWDDKNEFIGKDGAVAARGNEAALHFRELRSGVATLLMNSRRLNDPIAIHYSQASMRTEWMREQQPKGDAWVRRTSATERLDSRFLRVRESWCRLVEDLGLQYNFVSYDQLEKGELARGAYSVLILPASSALSERETAAINEFVRAGGVVLTESQPGLYDEHSRRLAAPRLAPLMADPGRGAVVLVSGDILNYHQHRLAGKEEPVRDWVGRLLKDFNVLAEIRLTDEAGKPATGVELHTFRNGGVTIAGVLTNPQLRVNELGPPEFKSNERFEKPRKVKLALPRQAHAVDLRGGQPLGLARELTVELDPYEPFLAALFPAELPTLKVRAPARTARGANAEIAISFVPPSPAATHIFHVTVLDPGGKPAPHYGGNVRAPAGAASHLIPFAVNDAEGAWRIEIRDVLTGQAQQFAIEVQ